MKRPNVSSRRVRPGADAGEMSVQSSYSGVGKRLRRLALYLGLGLVGLYLAGATAGFLWMRYQRKNEQITFMQVALLRWRAVRRELAAQQFVQAKKEFEGKNYQAAYLLYSAAVRNDPDNVSGRLAAARFFSALGATNLAIGLLEDGVSRTPGNEEILEATFDVITKRGREARALALIRRLSGGGPARSLLLQRYEVLATLNGEGAEPAARVLAQYPRLKTDLQSGPVVARVLWENRQRLEAIELLSRHLEKYPSDFSGYAQLARWESAAGMESDARRTADDAVRRFRTDPAPRLLVIELLGQPNAGNPASQTAIEEYLHEFRSLPECTVLLAELAGRKGWLDLAATCYQLSATRLRDVSFVALYYADALATTGRFADAMRVLADVENQTTGANQVFLIELRQRQVLIAARQGDTDVLRDMARRLGVVVANDQETRQGLRQHFARLRIREAVTELSDVAPGVRAPRTATQ